jgi:hypothetical protein
MLFKFYSHLGDPPDSEVFLAGVVELLSTYPSSVLMKLTSPITGLATTLKWRPQLAEIKEFCEAQMGPIRREQERQQLSKERRRALPPPAEDRSKRATYEELVARCRKDGLMIGDDRRESTQLSIDALKKKYGVSDTDLALIPDAKLPRNWQKTA